STNETTVVAPRFVFSFPPDSIRLSSNMGFLLQRPYVHLDTARILFAPDQFSLILWPATPTKAMLDAVIGFTDYWLLCFFRPTPYPLPRSRPSPSACCALRAIPDRQPESGRQSRSMNMFRSGCPLQGLMKSRAILRPRKGTAPGQLKRLNQLSRSFGSTSG